jgi:aminoglycoside phosphotransferase family enzyme
MAPLDIQELLRPCAYPHPVGEIKLRETHVSWVILTGSYTYKLKKPVKLEFLDMTSLARRRTLCDEEIRLNRRLAADLYLEVVTINRDSQGLRVAGAGTVVDYAVRMRQFEASEELPALLARRDVSCAEMAALGERLAEFHESAPHARRDIDFDYRSQLCQSVLGNLATLISHLPAGASVPELGPLIDWTHDTLHDLLPLMTERQRSGLVERPPHPVRLPRIRSSPAIHRRDERHRFFIHGSEELSAQGPCGSIAE